MLLENKSYSCYNSQEELMDKYPFGGRVRAARKQLGITGEKLSEACNIDPSYLRQIECGLKLPSLQVFIILCRELKVSPERLLADYCRRPYTRRGTGSTSCIGR